MKLAVSLGHGLEPSEVVGAAQRLEGFGYDFVWVSESVGFDSLPVLGAIAFGTERVGLGTGIVNVYSRSATQLAMAAATMAEISGGRFVLGIGSSTIDVVKRWHGLEFRGQLSRVGEYADALTRKLNGENAHAGTPFASIRKVPVYVAGVGEGMVKLARRKADGVIFFMRPRSDVEEKCRTLGSRTFRVCANVVASISRDARAAESRARKTVAFYITYGEPYRLLIERLGVNDEAREATLAVRNSWLKGQVVRASELVPKELLDQVAIYGSPNECAGAIEEYSRIRGLHMLGLQFNPVERNVLDSIGALSTLPGAI